MLYTNAASRSENEVMENEDAALPPARFNKHEALPGNWYGKRTWKEYETRKPMQSTLVPKGATVEGARRPELGEVFSMRFPVSGRRTTEKVKNVLLATQVSTQAASRDFVPGRAAYVAKGLKFRPSVYDGTDGPEELDLDGIEYQDEPKKEPAPYVKISNTSMKRKRQEKKLQILLESAARDGLLEEDENGNGEESSPDDESDGAEPPAKRAKVDEDSE
jgi:hypothetical protein